jgi:tripartite-type tricarboxylate transporter receptor subunit TctC
MTRCFKFGNILARNALLSVSMSLIGFSTAASAAAQTETPFYAGKRITVIEGYEPGGSYDQYARLLIRFMGNHIPGKPLFVAQNMLGAGTRVAANYLYNAAPKDGTVLGVLDQDLPLDQAMGEPDVKFDVRQFNWLGNMIVMNNTLVSWYTSGVRTFDDARKKSILIGGPGGPSPAVYYPRAANAFLGAKFQIITGYANATEMNLAMERGEVQGRGSNSWQSWKQLKPDWLRDHKISILFQVGFRREPDLPDVPLMTELATSPENRAPLELLSSPISFARTIVTPPGVPAERVKLLRDAFAETVKDPELLAEAQKEGLAIQPLLGEPLQKTIEAALDSPPEVVDRLKRAIEN